MTSGKLNVTHDEAEIFDRAVRDRALAVVTVQDGDAWQSFKCRFLERDPNRRFFVLDYEAANGVNPPPLALGQYVGVSFRHSSRKIMFATVVEAKGRYRCAGRGELTAVRYRWPQGLTELQRRAFYRTPIPEATPMICHLWSGGKGRRQAAQAGPLQIVVGQFVDLSCGGALIRVRGEALPTWSEGDTLGVELDLSDGRPPLLADAHFRGLRQDEQGRRCVAIQFVGLELTVEGRVVLERVAGLLQRLHRMSPPALSRNTR